jgi:hypothetical protein
MVLFNVPGNRMHALVTVSLEETWMLDALRTKRFMTRGRKLMIRSQRGEG